MIESYLIKPVNPKNGDKYTTKDGVWFIFNNGRWVVLEKKPN